MTLEVSYHSLPKVLLIRMKTSKYESAVVFPLRFEANELTEISNKKQAIYNLTCISNHYGDQHGGHCVFLF